MKKLVNCCDRCGVLGENLTLKLFDKQELCPRCVSIKESEHKNKIRERNRQNAEKLIACINCKHTGIIHKSIYACGPGYYDEPDPTIYCKCPRGRALDPDTNFIVSEEIF